MKIIEIDNKSTYLSSVRRLYRKNSSTLGFFPDGAFHESVAKRNILVAVTPDAKCVGYLLYRVSRQRIIIVHLCVDSSSREKGVGKSLIEYLKDKTKDYIGIGLSCRRDYKANKVWPRLNFIPLSERPGRGRDREHLTFWWYDHGHQTLFSNVENQLIQSKIRTTIDANVFFDLEEKNVTNNNIESKALLADWLSDSIVLCVTDEIYNEINRHGSPSVRKRQRGFADSFPKLQVNGDEFENHLSRIRKYFPRQLKPSDESDMRQLAISISANAQFFVTRDKHLHKIADQVYDEFGVNILRPSDLIIHLDELVRESEYRPIRLPGTLIDISLIKSVQTKSIKDTFLCSSKGESKKAFDRRLNVFLSDPKTYETLLIRDTENRPLALTVYKKDTKDRLIIPLIRIMKGALLETLARHLIFRSVRNSIAEGRQLIKVTDSFLDDDIINALRDNSFVEVGNEWLKFNICTADSAENISSLLLGLSTHFHSEEAIINNLSNTLRSAQEKKDTLSLTDLEKNIWPAKITDVTIPSYIIPIQAKWALHLFDEGLASQTLFGSFPDLLLRFENVYYRANRPRVVSSPARVLWYVSKDNSYQGSMHIRACSYIDNIYEDTSKNLFKKFRRLGVYGWRDVLEKANGKLDKKIMAIIFSHTELFKTPISWIRVQQILLSEEGKKSQIQSPVFISSQCFAKIYNLGTKN